jgi:hypothetical protein
METRPQVEKVLDDARRINQVLTRGKYGSQAERYWSVLRANITPSQRIAAHSSALRSCRTFPGQSYRISAFLASAKRTPRIQNLEAAVG